jgi:prevent-host-death family protein
MKSVNALELRQSLGRVLRQLERGGAPILVQRGREPAAVLISLRDYRERFADREADEHRRAIVAQIKATRFASPRGASTLDLLRELRAGRS